MRYLGLVILMVWASYPVYAQETQDQAKDTLEQRLQVALNEVVEETNWPGATAAVVLPDGEVIQLAAGLADVEAGAAMPRNARMLVGSTGKMIVSTVALQLVGEGMLKLDKPAADYLGSKDWFNALPNSGEITVRQLMNHTSGLPRYVFQPEFTDSLVNDPARQWTIKQRTALLADDEAVHVPGEGWAYSDTNYIVLGALLEQITGQSFYDLARQRVIEPLGLVDTIESDQPELPGLVQGYFGENNPFGLSGKAVVDGHYVINPQFEWCGGGFLSTTADLAQLARAIHAGELIPPEVHQQLVQAVDFRTGLPAETGYGLGTFVWKTDFGLFMGHAGIMPGYLTQVEYSQDHGFAVALQCNSDADMGRHHHHGVQELAGVVVAHLQQPGADRQK